MNGYAKIVSEAYFWGLLNDVYELHFRDWENMTVDEVLGILMRKSQGRLNPKTTKKILEQLQ